MARNMEIIDYNYKTDIYNFFYNNEPIEILLDDEKGEQMIYWDDIREFIQNNELNVKIFEEFEPSLGHSEKTIVISPEQVFKENPLLALKMYFRIK